jgi:hypothetical protein
VFWESAEYSEEEMTRPEEAAPVNPAEARLGDVLPGGYKVKTRIGQGFVSVVFLIETKDNRELILKVASSPDDNDRIRQEGTVLRDLRHQHIVALHDVLEVDLGTGGENLEQQRLHSTRPSDAIALRHCGQRLFIGRNDVVRAQDTVFCREEIPRIRVGLGVGTKAAK